MLSDLRKSWQNIHPWSSQLTSLYLSLAQIKPCHVRFKSLVCHSIPDVIFACCPILLLYNPCFETFITARFTQCSQLRPDYPFKQLSKVVNFIKKFSILVSFKIKKILYGGSLCVSQLAPLMIFTTECLAGITES